MEIVVKTSSDVPSFTQVAEICQGDVIAALPTVSNNDITHSIENEVKIFPQPAQGAVTIQLNAQNENINQIQIYDTQGRLINNSSNHCNTSASSSTGRFIHIEQEKLKLRNDSNGWTKMSNALKSVFQSTLSIEKYNLNEVVSVSPNPTFDKVLISAKDVFQIEVYNLLGQKVFQKKFNKVNNPIINFISQSKGIYFLKVKAGNGLALKKVIRL